MSNLDSPALNFSSACSNSSRMGSGRYSSDNQVRGNGVLITQLVEHTFKRSMRDISLCHIMPLNWRPGSMPSRY